MGCPDLVRPLSLTISSASSSKFAWLVDCGSSTDIMVLDSTMSLFSFPWSACSFLSNSSFAMAPEAVRQVLPLAVNPTQIGAGFLHGLVLISDPRALALQYAMEGDLASLTEYLNCLTTEQKAELAAFRDGRGNSIVHAAVKCYHSSKVTCHDVAHLAISGFSDLINCRNVLGQSPLLSAVSLAKLNIVVELLSIETILVDLQDEAGNTPLHVAVQLHARCTNDGELSNSLDKIIRCLIIDGVCSLDSRNSAGQSVVDLALSLEAVELAYKLYTFGAPVNVAELRRKELFWWLSIINTSGMSSRSAWICHSNVDWELAFRLQKSLVRSGVKATADQWKFSPEIHDSVSVIVFLITESSLRDERCLTELHQCVSQCDGVVLGIVCQDLVSSIPTSLRLLLRRTIFAVPQSPKARPEAPAAPSADDTSHSSFSSFDDHTDDYFDGISSQLPQVAAIPAEPGRVIGTIPVSVFEKLKQMLSQLLDQERAPSRRSSRIPPLQQLLDESKVAQAILMDPSRTFFTSTAADRSVRLFVSSTFKDMHMERELLVSHIFPHIERYCLDRRILYPINPSRCHMFLSLPLTRFVSVRRNFVFLRYALFKRHFSAAPSLPS
jgi:hypothetical protein